MAVCYAHGWIVADVNKCTLLHSERRTRVDQRQHAIIAEWGPSSDIDSVYITTGPLSPPFIDRSMEWRRRLEWVVQRQGKDIEHLMWMIALQSHRLVCLKLSNVTVISRGRLKTRE